jgi:phospholipid-binding lipoprotein MlaA
VRRLSAQRWRRTPSVVLVIAIIHLAPVCGADAPPPPLPEDAPWSGTVTEEGDLHAAEHPLNASPFEIWRAGPADANIPPEAFRLLAEQPGVSLAEFAQALSSDLSSDEEEFEDEIPEYDPWEPFNRKMFAFNQQVDRFVFKPVARVWNFVVPELAQQSLANAFDNIAMPRRLINHLLQLRAERAGRELARFFLNISMGVGGFFDVATELGIPRSDADTGQTLGRYGVGPGPYLVLPFLPPLTVRDGFGFAADAAMQPLSYVAPFEASVGMRGGQIVNDRSLNLENFEQLERMTFDLYSAVRNAYLQRRQRMIED